jgi:hypothetical protein
LSGFLSRLLSLLAKNLESGINSDINHLFMAPLCGTSLWIRDRRVGTSYSSQTRQRQTLLAAVAVTKGIYHISGDGVKENGGGTFGSAERVLIAHPYLSAIFGERLVIGCGDG